MRAPHDKPLAWTFSVAQLGRGICNPDGLIVLITARLASDVLEEVRIALLRVPFNTLFAGSVLDGLVDGEIWCGEGPGPSFAHLVHPYGMSLLIALSAEPDFDAIRKHLEWRSQSGNGLWMQIHPQTLAPRMDALLDAEWAGPQAAPSTMRVRRFTRCNFQFVPTYRDRLTHREALPPAFNVRPMTARDFDLPGFSVSPRYFWRNAGDFLAHGGGWCVAQGEDVASIAFSSFRRDCRLEIGVETHPGCRGRGLAKYAASALVDHCFASGIEPVWSCRKENEASWRLATSLGFTPTMEVAYYHLPGMASQS